MKNTNREINDIIIRETNDLNDKDSFNNHNYRRNPYEEYELTKCKPWTSFISCPTIFLILSFMMDSDSVFVTMWITTPIWLSISCFVCAYKIHKNNDLRDYLGINTPQKNAKSKILETSLTIAGISIIKEEGKFIKNVFKPHDKEV